MPGVGAAGTGLNDERLVCTAVARRRVLLRPARCRIDTFRPAYRYEGCCRDQLPCCAIEHIHEAVGRRLHQNGAMLTVDEELRQNKLAGSVKSPFVSRSGLVVPDVLARI